MSAPLTPLQKKRLLAKIIRRLKFMARTAKKINALEKRAVQASEEIDALLGYSFGTRDMGSLWDAWDSWQSNPPNRQERYNFLADHIQQARRDVQQGRVKAIDPDDMSDD